MTLSAITKEGRVITPYKMVVDGGAVKAHEAYRSIESLKSKGVKLFCLDCYYEYGEYFPVNLRKTDASKVRPHFSHPPGQSCQSKPASPESIDHRTAKEFIAKHLEDGGAKVFVERRIKSGDVCRQPDVMAVRTDCVEAHEVQLSRIDSSALRQRSEDLAHLLSKSHPGKRVQINWYLSDKNQTKDNWLVFRQQEWWGYKIWFDDGIPSWHLASPGIIKNIVLAEARERKEKAKKKLELERRLKQQQEQARKHEEERLRHQREAQERRYEEEQIRRNEEKLRRQKQDKTKLFDFLFWSKLWSKFDILKTIDILLHSVDELERQSAEEYRQMSLRAAEEARQKLLNRIATVGYKRGDLVRGVPGRASENWKGKVVNVQTDGNVYVDWDGRRQHSDARVKRQPILFMLKDQITPIC